MKNQQGFFLSFKYAFKGILKLLKERNARIHFVAAAIVLSGALYFQISSYEWMLVVFAIGSVIAAEAFNTSIENFIDLISPEIKEKAGAAKDLAAGAVLVTAITAVITGLIIFGPRLYMLLN